MRLLSNGSCRIPRNLQEFMDGSHTSTDPLKSMRNFSASFD